MTLSFTVVSLVKLSSFQLVFRLVSTSERHVCEVSTATIKYRTFYFWNRLVVVWWSLGGGF